LPLEISTRAPLAHSIRRQFSSSADRHSLGHLNVQQFTTLVVARDHVIVNVEEVALHGRRCSHSKSMLHQIG
jgi:hypothetical protein